jgi:Tfp pilus assembly pilus retraction ATPase PilT
MDAVLEQKFLKFLDVAIAKSITDIHIGSGSFAYIRAANRDIKPIEQFGVLTYDDVISLVLFMNPILTQEKIESISTGVSFVYAYSGTRFRANVSKNNEGIAIALRSIKKNTPTAE